MLCAPWEGPSDTDVHLTFCSSLRMSSGFVGFRTEIERKKAMQTMSHVEKINPQIKGWRVKLMGEPLMIVLAPSRVEAIRLAKVEWASQHRRGYGAAPECVQIRRAR